jgi:cytochrome c oxidase assembly factor 1
MNPLRSTRPLLTTNILALPPSTRSALFRLSQTQPILYPRRSATTAAPPTQPSPFIPAPKEGSGPLLSRQANRELPDVGASRNVWLYTLPIFTLVVAASALAFFNYQKASSSTVSSILYALRTNPAARELLGDEIYFASNVPWIRGEMSQMQGNIDITFWVKGTRGVAKTRFVARRKEKRGTFATEEWSLTKEDGSVLHLLEHGDVRVQGSLA